MNHIVVGALMLVLGAFVTFTAASAVQIWATSRQSQAEYDPHADRILAHPAFEYRKRPADCQPPLWPQAVLPSKANYQQR